MNLVASRRVWLRYWRDPDPVSAGFIKIAAKPSYGGEGSKQQIEISRWDLSPTQK